ncbi:MAG: hypothetical protein MI924_04755 [Chloroflexales bacterium]|nr:hypothetical protein [Chloroflexales bacterium]
MAESKDENTSRSRTPRQDDDVIAASSDLGESFVRFSVAALTWPSAFLPEEMRPGMRKATSNFVHAVADMHRDFAQSALDAVGGLTREASSQEPSQGAKSRDPGKK